MNLSGPAAPLPRLTGPGEVVLHNLKNWLGRRAADARPLASEEAARITDILHDFFDQAESFVRSAVRLGELEPDACERFARMLNPPRQCLAEIKTKDSGHALDRLAAFLADQYNRGGMLSQAVQGETIERNDTDPLSTVERALVTVVRALAPPHLLDRGSLRFQQTANERELLIDGTLNDPVYHMGIHIGIWYHSPIRLGRIRSEVLKHRFFTTIPTQE
ncbi:MAG: hypothetical protein JJU29_01750 [Verrucomicrobia bacterium]|nr:hypothetical protein [Verrucomicrobiota bacterium]MCH8510957.1 hypothetical protein [Kiritimatiellia bacterium]